MEVKAEAPRIFDLPSCKTLLEVLDLRAVVNASDVYIRFLSQSGTIERILTFAELHRRATAIARQFTIQGLSAQRVILAFPQGPDFLVTFFACLYAGVIAVPVHATRHRSEATRLAAIEADCGSVLTLNPAALTQYEEYTDVDNGARILPSIDQTAIAFLQYTSGSTGKPKGVAVTHHNLVFNQRLIQTTFEHSERTVFASWLPLFHDMGLIGNALQPLYLGIPCILMSPLSFLEDPSLLLRSISQYGVTTCGMPNFGYEHCVRRIKLDDLAGVDLSHWDLAYNGSEPISPGTLDRFAQRFGQYGFNKQAFYPCYGLAEATLLVTGSRKLAPSQRLSISRALLAEGQIAEHPQDDPDAVHLVSSGLVGEARFKNIEDSVYIVEPHTLVPCSANAVGEIWVQNEGVALGYWGNPAETDRNFKAFDRLGHGPCLRTGDLGFIRNGNLFITGRLKELLIIRGQNHYPQDIENTIAELDPLLGLQTTAAIGYPVDGEERLVILQEVNRALLPTMNRIRSAQAIRDIVAKQHSLSVFDVLFLSSKAIPRTTSGKIRRLKCRHIYEVELASRLSEEKLFASEVH